MKRVPCMTGVLLALLAAVPLAAQQPTGTIRGRVTDETTQQPLSGASVMIAGHATQTIGDGTYALSGVAAGTDTLRIRMIGYAPTSRPVTVREGQTVLVDVTMAQQAIELSALVSVGYGQQHAGNVTGSMLQVSDSDFNPGQIVTPTSLIQSKVAGVQVVDNNSPGGGLAIRIRGTTSVNASSDPLYVVDGVPLGTGSGGGLSAGGDPLSFLNPSDIASITVLKDAASAAIYGANAANGVVLITTKTGRNAPHVVYSTSFSSASVVKVPGVLNAAQFRTAVAHDDSLSCPPAGGACGNRLSMLGSANTDWFSLIDRNAFAMQHNIAVSGAGTNNSYRLSLGYFNQDGVVKSSGVQRLSLGMNYEQHLLHDDLTLTANVNGARTYNEFQAGEALGDAVSMAPTQPVFDPNNTQGYGNGYWDWNNSGANASNPVAALALTSSKGVNWRSVGNMTAEYRLPFLQALKAHVDLAYDYSQNDNQTFVPSNLASQSRSLHGFMSLSNASQINTTLDMYLNYAAPLVWVPGSVDVTGGYSYEQSHANYPSMQETNLSSNLLGPNGIVGGVIQNFQSVVDSRLISFFGRVNYNLNNTYLASFSLRRDGSSRFGPSNAWGYFPAFSLGWRLSQMPFFRNITALSDLKLRGSWGETGNQAFGDYLQYPNFVYSNPQAQYQLGNQVITTIRPSAVDPNIKWESTATTDIGLDYGFLNERFTGSIDWYQKKTSNLIFTVPVAAATNFSNYVTENVGSMQNTGLELSLNARILDGGPHKLGYTANFTASTNANKMLTVTSAGGSPIVQVGNISGGVGTTIQVLEPGQPVNSFYVCKQYFQNGKPVEGKYFYANTDSAFTSNPGSDNCDARGLVPDHNPAPSWILGHTSYLTYGHWDLSFTLRAYLGNYVYNNVASSTGFYNAVSNGGSPSNMSTSVLNTGFVVPRYLSSVYVQDASFLRMDNITLGYGFTYKGQPMRVYGTIQNAFTITGYSGVDPTAGVGGIDNNIYPSSRTFTGGLSVQF